VWDPSARRILKSRDVVFEEADSRECISLRPSGNEEDDPLPPITTSILNNGNSPTENATSLHLLNALPFGPASEGVIQEVQPPVQEIAQDTISLPHSSPLSPPPDLAPEEDQDRPLREPSIAPRDFEQGPWMNPSNEEYGRGKRRTAHIAHEYAAFAHGVLDLESTAHSFLTLATDEPATFKQAMHSPAHDKWFDACKSEISQLKDYGVYSLVTRPVDINVVGNRWVFRLKRDNKNEIIKYKARLVAQGFTQVYGVDYDETFSPTIRLTSVRFILALANTYGLVLRQMDVRGAYLNGTLTDTVYMEQPEGFIEEGQENLVCLLHKGLYGLKQSGRVWREELKKRLESIGYTTGAADSTIFFKFSPGSIRFAGWFVDDGLLGAYPSDIEDFAAELKSILPIDDFGEPSRFLAMQIERDSALNTIHLSQGAYIDTIARRYNVTAGRSVLSPMDNQIVYHSSFVDDSVLDVPYASAIGALNYCAVATRPDIAFAVNKLAQYASRPSVIHWDAVKRVIRYLLHTRDYGITFRADGRGIEGYAHGLAGYTDADFAGDVDDRRSTTGWVFTYHGAPISWSSKKQHLVTRSTMESEFVASSFASAEGIWLVRLAKDFQLVARPIPIFVDNQSALAFARNDVHHNRTKHIDVHFHYTREQLQQGNIDLHYIPGVENPADIFTKALSTRKHVLLLAVLGIGRV